MHNRNKATAKPAEAPQRKTDETITLNLLYKKTKKSSDVLLQADNLFENIFNATGDGCIVTDDSGYIIKANRKTYSLLGYDEHTLLGKHITELSPDEYTIGENPSLIIRLLDHGFVEKHETVFLRGDGTPADIEINLSLLKDHRQNTIGAFSSFRDITDKKRAEEELRATKDQLQEIFNTTRDGVILTDECGSIIKVNKAMESILGFQEEELLGRYTIELSVEEDAYIYAGVGAFREALDNGSSSHYESLWLRKDGTTCPVELNLTISKDAQDNARGIVWAVRDISGRKLAQQGLTMLGLAVEQAAETILIMDKNGAVEYINAAAERMFGYSLSDAGGLNPFQARSDLYDLEFYMEIWDTITAGDVWKGRMKNRRSDGNIIEIEVAISPVRDDTGQIRNYVAICRDITQEILFEKQLQQAHKMEAIGTLAGGIAHDFNNILTVISGFTEIAYDAGDKGSVIHNSLTEVLKASERATDLVKQILTFSRQTESITRPVRIKPIIKEAHTFLRASLPTTITISLNLQAPNDIVMSDPTKIHQVLMNLCTNAKNAMQETGGELTIGLFEEQLIPDMMDGRLDLSPGPYLKLTVEDTGCGMEPGVQERIFDPFFSTRQQGGGTGLGLSVVHGIIKSCSGDITVGSVPGKGTVFNVYLPLVEEQAPPQKALDNTPIVGGTEHALVVDDEQQIAEMIKKFLENLGYRVTTRTSSLEALEAFRYDPEKFDFVITDQTMPNLTGAELSREVLKIKKDIPIILCTGFSETITEEKAKSIGIRAFIMKPIVFTKLADTIRNLLAPA